MQSWAELVGDAQTAALTGLVVGLAFGAFAQQSRFCLRSACIEFWRARPGPKFAIWLITFSAALALTQIQIWRGSLDPSTIRQLTATGSMSGAIIGGAMFGTGMILARGCASRLLVLSATGNLRALVAGLVLTLIAQASLTGIFSPLRMQLSTWWLVGPASRDMALWLPPGLPMLMGAVLLVAGIALAWRKQAGLWIGFGAFMTGAAVALGWYLTAWHASWSFDVIPVKSVSFTGPSANTLMALVTDPSIPLTFDTGLVPGVFVGSMIAAFLTREFRWQSFDADTGMLRYLVGAALMGFGGMLAGGCAVGAGVTGGSVMALTAWIALLAMWLSAGIADALLDRPSGAPEGGQNENPLTQIKAAGQAHG
ncbi:MAG: YeeE/YedE family protein [Nitratireductor sp.]|nr:YeeE/YedE family protein [Nitratireductor sp.]MCB1457079.1 YeeE/YedE family protein [Nitratireductor sp.]